MKLTKKLIPAIGMLMLSTAMMVTSSFAWFSMNTDVSATGMSVEAVADQVYLQIVAGSDEFSNTTAQTSATAKNATRKLKPTNVVKAITDKKDGETVVLAKGATEAFDGSTIVWVNNTSASPDSATANNAYQDITSSVTDVVEGSYALYNTFKIRLNPTTGNTVAAAPLKVANVVFANDTNEEDDMRNTVSVLVVCGNQAQLWKQATAGTFTATGDTYLAQDEEGTNVGKFTSTAGVDVKVYVFFDGDHTDCKTNNVVSDHTYSVQVNFTCL